MNSLHQHVATLKADIEKLEAVIAMERERADRALMVERERADRSIAAFETLAWRLEEMAEARRPWWRRLTSARKGGT